MSSSEVLLYHLPERFAGKAPQRGGAENRVQAQRALPPELSVGRGWLVREEPKCRQEQSPVC